MKKLKILFLSLIAMTSVVSCVVEDEVASEQLTDTPYAVGFKRASKSVNVLLTGEVQTINEPIEILGGSDFTDNNPEIEVNLAVDPSSTAVEGTHFTMATKKVVIPAGARFVTIPIKILSENIQVNNNKRIVLNVTSANGSVIPTANKKLTVTLVGVCVSDLAGEYSNTSNANQCVVSEIGPGLYRATYLAPFANTYWFEFSDVCGVLTITNWQFQDTNPLTASPGSVGADGSLNFPSVTVAGVSWYVNRAIKYVPNN